jgi:predicted CXXCH cytochrome family protein
MLYDTVHSPVAKGMCAQCHEPPSSPNRFKTKQVGVQACRGCHNAMVSKALDKGRIHRPVVEGRACLTCHSPHAAKKPKLVKANLLTVCGDCHSDTIGRQDRSVTKHKPILEGDCAKCHDPHSSDAALMFVSTDGVQLCGKCHDWQKHSSHPIGASHKDPRNENLRMECLSCHRAHGTEYKHMMPYPKTSDLCTKCHEKFMR